MLLTDAEREVIVHAINQYGGSCGIEVSDCPKESLPCTFSRNNYTKICKLANGFLECQYRLKKEEYNIKGLHEVQWLYHITGQNRIEAIKRTNLDFRRVLRGKYGAGVSFSPSFEYGNRYASRSISSNRVAIIAEVLIGSRGSGTYNGEYDTTDIGRVVVKYQDNEFFPYYLVYFYN